MLCDPWHGGRRRTAHYCALLKHDFDGGVKSAGGFGLRYALSRDDKLNRRFDRGSIAPDPLRRPE